MIKRIKRYFALRRLKTQIDAVCWQLGNVERMSLGPSHIVSLERRLCFLWDDYKALKRSEA